MLKILRLMSFTPLLFCSLAWGHAFPKQETPGAGEIISSKATQISITFNSELEPVFSTLLVKNVKNQQVSKGKGMLDPQNHALLQTQIPALPPGEYRVIWNVVAVDGHHTN